MMTLPNDDWFERLATAPWTNPELFAQLGFADLRLVVEVVDGSSARRFGLVLDGYDVTYVGELGDVAAFGPHAILTGPADAWNEMIESIDTHGAADRYHTLNALTIAETPMRVEAPDPMGRDRFFRYAETLQALFDATARRPAAI